MDCLYFINIHSINYVIKKGCFVEVGIKKYSMIIAKAETSILTFASTVGHYTGL